AVKRRKLLWRTSTLAQVAPLVEFHRHFLLLCLVVNASRLFGEVLRPDAFGARNPVRIEIVVGLHGADDDNRIAARIKSIEHAHWMAVRLCSQLAKRVP